LPRGRLASKERRKSGKKIRRVEGDGKLFLKKWTEFQKSLGSVLPDALEHPVEGKGTDGTANWCDRYIRWRKNGLSRTSRLYKTEFGARATHVIFCPQIKLGICGHGTNKTTQGPIGERAEGDSGDGLLFSKIAKLAGIHSEHRRSVLQATVTPTQRKRGHYSAPGGRPGHVTTAWSYSSGRRYTVLGDCEQSMRRKVVAGSRARRS